MRKTLLISLLTLLAFANLNLGHSYATKPEEPTRLVKDWFAAFNRHDADTIQRLYADDAVLEDPNHQSLWGNKEIADTYRRLFTDVPDVHDETKSMDRSGDKVFVEFVSTGEPKGAKRQRFSLRSISVREVKAGRIVRDATYYDRQP